MTYLWPEKPTFLGFLIMVSIYKSLERSVFFGPEEGFRFGFRACLGFHVSGCRL